MAKFIKDKIPPSGNHAGFMPVPYKCLLNSDN